MGCGTSKHAPGASAAAPQMVQTAENKVAAENVGGPKDDASKPKNDTSKKTEEKKLEVAGSSPAAGKKPDGDKDEPKPLSKAASALAIGTIITAVVSEATDAIRKSRASLANDTEHLIKKGESSPSSPIAPSPPAIIGLDSEGQKLSVSNLVYQGGDEGNKYKPGREADDKGDKVEWVLLPPGQLPEGVDPDAVKQRLEVKDEGEVERPTHATRPVLKKNVDEDGEETEEMQG